MLVIYLLTGWLVKHSFINNFNHSKNTENYKVLVIWGNGTGEREQTYRFKIAAKRLDLKLEVVSKFGNNFLQQHFIANPAELAANLMQPDLILTIERNIHALNSAPNYLVLDQSASAYFNNNSQRLIMYDRNIFKFTGLLPTFPEFKQLQQVYSDANEKLIGFTWYPTIYRTTYVPQTPQRLFYPGGILRDITRSSAKYKAIFTALDATDYFEVHGSRKVWAHTPKSRRNPIPFDGVSLLEAQNQAGISLVLHDAEHLYGRVPSSRIFEASAANTVIISDRHEFILHNFGTNILYVDVEQNAQSIAAQIDKHVQWIKANPALAKQMANNCHQIFLKKFNLEDQLRKLIDLNLKEVANA